MERGAESGDDNIINSHEIFDKAYRHQRLREAVYSSWAELVPVVVKSHRTPMPSDEQSATDEQLLRPLLWFMSGGEDPELFFEQLKQKEMRPPLCGHVFKSGEPNYSCRQCATDPTCVFCIECFQGSIHKSHQYRMSTSVGGGCCDCGDIEAWSAGYCCEIHKPAESTTTTTQVSDARDQLPGDLQQKVIAVLRIILEYCYEMLVWEEGESLPPVVEEYLMPRKLPPSYCTMVFNDESHTFDQVIDTLKLAVDNCTQKDAVAYATAIDREGRSCVMTDVRSLCVMAASIITLNAQMLPSRPQLVSTSKTRTWNAVGISLGKVDL